MEKLQFIKEELSGKKILILGFGKEGQSTCHFLLSLIPGQAFTIADSKAGIENDFPNLLSHPEIHWECGPQYLNNVFEADVIVKSPGIPFKTLPDGVSHKVTSQTTWFIRAYRNQICGITGTKGKSTTSSLLYHLLKLGGKDTILVGNIGIPPLSAIQHIKKDTLIVFELSCHQLQGLKLSPSSAILLNIFQEHLDHYKSLREYQLTKLNIGLYQQKGDLFFIHDDDLVTQALLKQNTFQGNVIHFSLEHKDDASIFCTEESIVFKHQLKEITLVENTANLKLLGNHNLLNIMAASALAYLKGVDSQTINQAVHSFKPLEHRLEDIGVYHGIHFYNDSISTTPESCIQALIALKEVDTLIVGGYERNLSFNKLINFLQTSTIRSLIVTGEAGLRIRDELIKAGNFHFIIKEAKDYSQVIEIALQTTRQGKICLLSPAAASYDWFKNFEERGITYKTLIKNYSGTR